MKKIILLLFLFSAVGVVAQNSEKNPFTLGTFEESRSDAGMKNLGTLFRTDWPIDKKTGKNCAWIRLRYENMTETDLEGLEFNGVEVVKKEYTRENRTEQTLSLFVAPVTESGAFFEVSHKAYGRSNRVHDFVLSEKSVYYITLRREAGTSITISTKPQNVVGRLDYDKLTDENGNIQNVTLGTHTLELLLDGTVVRTDTINVTEDNIRFDYDVRKRRRINFTSDPSDCDLYLDGAHIGRTPMSVELPYGSYHVEARVSAKENDAKDFTVDDNSGSIMELEPIRKKRIEVYAVYNGEKVSSYLKLNGKDYSAGNSVYTLDLPVGERHEITMSYANSSKTRKIMIRENMNHSQRFTISAKNKFLWPWERIFDDAVWGFSAAYVSKQWVSRGNGYIYRGNAAWAPFEQCDPENQRMHGVQLGWHYNPCFKFGLGLHTGIFTEIYGTKTGQDVPQTDWNSSFREISLYVPLHLLYRFPVGEETALYLHGGLGFDYGLLGFYTNSDAWAGNSYSSYYGEEGFPDRFNMSSEIGFGMRYKRIMLNMQYSKGITNHDDVRFHYFNDKMPDGDTKTKQNKLTLGLSYMYGGDYDTDWMWEDTEGKYDWGFSMAYVSKQWVSRYEGNSFKGNAVWGSSYNADVKKERLHGMQMGISYNPYWKRGLGLYTGLFFELYMSGVSDDAVFPNIGTYDDYAELDMYVPLHMMFWVPLGEYSALQLRGGLGVDCGLYSEYTGGESDESGSSEYFGEDGFPDRFNYSAELALAFRIKRFSMFCQMSRGLNNHKKVVFSEFYNGDDVEVTTSQNKFSLGISVNW